MTNNEFDLYKRIAEIRTKQGLVNKKFAERIGKSEAWCEDLEVGIKTFTISILGDIADALKIPIWCLFLPIGSPVLTSPHELSNATDFNPEREAYKAHIQEQKFRINEFEQIIHKLLDKI